MAYNARKMYEKFAADHNLDETVSSIKHFFASTFKYENGADSTADATETTLMWTNPHPFPVELLSAKYTAATATLTANASNYATIQIGTDDGAAGTIDDAFSVDTTAGGSGNWAAKVAENIPVSDTAEVIVPVGGSVYYVKAVAGTGVIVPAGTITVAYCPAGTVA
ncbi:MAG TPA: hypothetical protein VFZ21_30965 [Gemmatimonadaceae bacterium]|nr:hypothetical protein [Gemmatimonadaceae bacterium]